MIDFQLSYHINLWEAGGCLFAGGLNPRHLYLFFYTFEHARQIETNHSK